MVGAIFSVGYTGILWSTKLRSMCEARVWFCFAWQPMTDDY